jgi:hypothetical protein
MTIDFLKQSTDFTDKMINAAWLQQVSEYYKTLAVRQQAYAENALADLSSHLNDLTKVRTPQDFIHRQQDFLHDNIHRGVKQVQETLALTAGQLDGMLACCQEQPKAGKKAKHK